MGGEPRAHAWMARGAARAVCARGACAKVAPPRPEHSVRINRGFARASTRSAAHAAGIAVGIARSARLGEPGADRTDRHVDANSSFKFSREFARKNTSAPRWTDLAIRNLHHACFHGFLDKVKELHAQGVRLNAPSAVGHSPLSSSAMQGKVKIIKYLLKNGVDVNERDPDGHCAIYFAVHLKKPRAVSVLLQSRADADAHRRTVGQLRHGEERQGGQEREHV